MNPLDLAHRMVSQQRQLVDFSGPGRQPQGSILNSVDPLSQLMEAKFGQFAERVSVLVSNLTRRLDSDRLELEQQLRDQGARQDGRLTGLEARTSACEDRLAAQDRRIDAGLVPDRATGEAAAGAVLREMQAQLRSSMEDLQELWGKEAYELRGEQKQQQGQLEEAVERLRHLALGAERAEQGLTSHDALLRRTEEQLKGLTERHNAAPTWFGQLEAAVSGVECRLSEQQAQAEMQLSRLRIDMDGLRRHSDGILQSLRDDATRAVEGRMERSKSRSEGSGFSHDALQQLREHGRRLDDSESRLAALRVRVDGQDTRLGGMGERLELSTQQAIEAARQVAAQQREDILLETDVQLKIVRQRMETLSQLMEDLMDHQVPVQGLHSSALHHASGGARRHSLGRQAAGGR